MKQNDFDYMQMLKGELYYAPPFCENKSTKGKVLAQKSINFLSIT